ncbi:MAG: response regulator [Actinomycetota bacterium]|nr:response regulator [Actinomycetota bacterium]
MAETGAPKKVLVVDDEEGIRSLLKVMFESDPRFDIVAEAEDGVEALSLALRHHPDYVILDYSMPRMNGEEAARVLRGMQTNLCIVAFSSVVTDRPAWADAHLSKEQFNELLPLLQSLEANNCSVP